MELTRVMAKGHRQVSQTDGQSVYIGSALPTFSSGKSTPTTIDATGAERELTVTCDAR
jgi:hypothetical protein